MSIEALPYLVVWNDPCRRDMLVRADEVDRPDDINPDYVLTFDGAPVLLAPAGSVHHIHVLTDDEVKEYEEEQAACREAHALFLDLAKSMKGKAAEAAPAVEDDGAPVTAVA